MIPNERKNIKQKLKEFQMKRHIEKFGSKNNGYFNYFNKAWFERNQWLLLYLLNTWKIKRFILLAVILIALIINSSHWFFTVIFVSILFASHAILIPRYWFRWAMRIHKDLKFSEDVYKIMPNHYTVKVED